MKANPHDRHKAGGRETSGAIRALASRMDSAIDRAIEERRIVGAVVLVGHDGVLVYQRAAGFADRERGLPMREQSIFLLASIAKPIVSLAALRLVEQGKLRLEDTVTRWLPDFRPRLASGEVSLITVHQLLTHTAGLTYKFMEGNDGPYHRLGISDGLDAPGITLAENLRRIAQAPLLYPPGTRWGYSLSMDVIGAVLEAVCSAGLQQVVAQLVTEPLGMRDTAFRVTDTARLVSHYADGKPEPIRMGELQRVPFNEAVIDFAPGRLLRSDDYPSGGGGVAGTASDVHALLQVFAGREQLVSPQTLERMLTPHVGPEQQTQGPGWGFGYGGAVLVDPVAAATPQSPGTMQWGGAYGHSWFVDRKQRWTAVALSNTAFEGMVGRFTTDVRDSIYGARSVAA